MWKLYMLICTLCVWLKATEGMGHPDLRCMHPRCKSAGGIVTNGHLFFVEGKKVFIVGDLKSKLFVNCQNWRALDSPALPRFTSAVEVSSVTLYKCPPPSNSTFADALAALNVKLLQSEINGELKLWDLPSQPQLNARHFDGLEHLVSLTLRGYWNDLNTPAPDFLLSLRNLRNLNVRDLELPTGELNDPPTSLQSLYLTNSGVRYLPQAVKALSSLQYIELDGNVLRADNANNMAPTIDTAWVNMTAEQRPKRLVRCEVLRWFHVDLFVVEALPERWVAVCPLLEHMMLYNAPKLNSLPKNLLEGASALSRFEFVYGKIETLPEGLFAHVPNLRYINLSNNRLRLLSSEVFVGPRALQTLDLSGNQLGADVQDKLAQLSNLIELNLGENPIGDLCEQFGNSRLINLTELKTLTLSDTRISRICSDWRLNMTKLNNLYLIRTNVSKLTFADLQYSRTKINSYVYLWGAPVNSVQFTEDDYKAAMKAPATHATVALDPNTGLDCDCKITYWTRMALETAKHTIRLQNLNCNAQYGHRALSSFSSNDELCSV